MATFTELPARVAARIEVADCWEWAGWLDKDGYGKVKVEKVDWRVHRFIWTRLVGPIPDELQIDHLCRNRKCCNPDHLDLVDARTNTLRGENRAARNARKVLCHRGHPLTQGKRQRFCLVCRKEASHRYNAAHRTERAAAQRARQARRKAN